MIRHYEYETVRSGFKTEKDALRWAAEKQHHGYDVVHPYRNQFPFCNVYPWEVTATRFNYRQLNVEEELGSPDP